MALHLLLLRPYSCIYKPETCLKLPPISRHSLILSGSWSADEGNSKLTLAGNVWTIHHLEGNTLRIGNTVDSVEVEIDFEK